MLHPQPESDRPEERDDDDNGEDDMIVEPADPYRDMGDPGA